MRPDHLRGAFAAAREEAEEAEDTDELDPPKPGHYRVWWPEMDGREEWAKALRATSPEAAAEEWARRDDNDGDYTIISGTTARLHVRDSAGAIHVFDVVGHQEPVYTAVRVTG